MKDIQCEVHVLGAVLRDAEVIIALREMLLPDDFVDRRHRPIYEIMLQLVEKRIRPTVASVADALAAAQLLSMAGGVDYVCQLEATLVGGGSLATMDAPVWAEKLVELADRRALDRLADQVKVQANDMNVAPDDLWREVRAAVLRGKRQSASGGYKTFAGGVGELRGKVDAWLRGEKPDTLSTGIATLDYHLLGLERRRLTVFGARPGMGKTMLAQCIAGHVESEGGVVVFISLDMSFPDLMLRELCRMAGTDSRALRRGDFEGNPIIRSRLENALQRMEARQGVFVADQSYQMVIDMHYRAELLALDTGQVDLHITDYTELIGDVLEAPDVRLGVVTAMRRQKALAKGLNCASLVLSQLNRDAEGRLPALSDLMFGGEAEADNAVLFWWPWKSWSRDGHVKLGILGKRMVLDSEGEPRKNSYWGRIGKARDGEEAIVELEIDPVKGLIKDAEDSYMKVGGGK